MDEHFDIEKRLVHHSPRRKPRGLRGFFAATAYPA
jgi:hypothetical protein